MSLGEETYIINDIIKDLLLKENYSLSTCSGLDAAGGVFCASFRPCSPGSLNCVIPLTYEIIFRRLVLIDSLFFTHTDKGCYIKQNMATAIFNACNDGTEDGIGVYSDYILAKKASDYILWTIDPSSAPVFQDQTTISNIYNLLHKKYTWVKNKPGNEQMELSLMTKYLHYLVESVRPTNTDGVPIKDRLVNQMLPIVYHYLFNKTCHHSTFADYTKALWRIATALKTADPALWTCPSMTTFHILDLFMWQLGKVYKADGDYTQLWMLVTETELMNMLTSPSVIPTRIHKLETLVQKLKEK